MLQRDLEKAATRGEPSYVWREGQRRRLRLIVQAAGPRVHGVVLENGCGVGLYLEQLEALGGKAIGLEYDFARARDAHGRAPRVVNAASEQLPLRDASVDLILSHEVIEHVADDRQAIREMVRCLRPGGRLVLFCPNRGYPFETHGIFWRGQYFFGNKLFVNYLPLQWRNRLAPHVRVYSSRSLSALFEGLPVSFIERRVIFGAYDNLIKRFGWPGRALRRLLQGLERSPFQTLGLSHFWVVEKIDEGGMPLNRTGRAR